MTSFAQRNLNNAFAYDLVPSVSVVAAALKAARRVNDFPTAVRIFEGMRYPLAVISEEASGLQSRSQTLYAEKPCKTIPYQKIIKSFQDHRLI